MADDCCQSYLDQSQPARDDSCGRYSKLLRRKDNVAASHTQAPVDTQQGGSLCSALLSICLLLTLSACSTAGNGGSTPTPTPVPFSVTSVDLSAQLPRQRPVWLVGQLVARVASPGEHDPLGVR